MKRLDSVESFRLAEALAKKFHERCTSMGTTRTAALRKLVQRWLRQTDEIARLKERNK